ncbi:hypothetical protein [Lentzea sp.]|nr:hypothetical protein [Lentzea sp.]HUQ57778.1 hypothetical protein [Lentzea sp.]
MEFMNAVMQDSTTLTVPVEKVPELTIHDVLKGVVTFDEYRSSKEE